MSVNKEITIPTELREITLSKHLALVDFINNETDDIEVSIKVISLMCNMTKDEVRGLGVGDFNDILQTLTDTINKKVNYVKPPNFKLGEVEYGFIPNLDEMTFGEYVDLDTFVKNPKDLHKVMTVLYRPIIAQSFGKYRIEKYTGKEDFDVMLDAPMDAVNSSLVFFYTLGKDLVKATMKSLEEAMNEKDFQSSLTSELSGDGIKASMRLLMEALESSMTQPVYQFTKR